MSFFFRYCVCQKRPFLLNSVCQICFLRVCTRLVLSHVTIRDNCVLSCWMVCSKCVFTHENYLFQLCYLSWNDPFQMWPLWYEMVCPKCVFSFWIVCSKYVLLMCSFLVNSVFQMCYFQWMGRHKYSHSRWICYKCVLSRWICSKFIFTWNGVCQICFL